MLKDIGARDFLRDDLGLKDSDEQFIRQRGVKHFRRLSRLRNDAEHNRTPDRTEVDALYAEALGIGQAGRAAGVSALAQQAYLIAPATIQRFTEPPLRVPARGYLHLMT